MHDDEVVAIVPFRAGSKGLKGKNFRLLNGTPLWERAAIQGSRTCSSVICTSDAEVVISGAINNAIQFDKRPIELAQDTSEMKCVIRHVIKKFDLSRQICVLLQPTSPLRSDNSIKKALDTYLDGCWTMVMSVKQVSNKVLKYGLNVNGAFTSINDPSFCFANRQDLPNVVAPNGAIYIFRGQDFLDKDGFPDDNIGIYEMDELESHDVDTEDDLEKIAGCLT